MTLSDRSKFDILVVTGPTACGKTSLAVALAAELDGEIISADSRQVYRRMDIGTGKDLSEYTVEGKQIPYHMIDVADAGTRYNVYEWQQGFLNAYVNITNRGKLPILCGGTGMYIESVIKGYEFDGRHFPPFNSLIIGLVISRDQRREKISRRLRARLEEGMIEEVENLRANGATDEFLYKLGLEYRYILMYLRGEFADFDAFYEKLFMEIRHLAKEQMTWFRKRTDINWIDMQKEPFEEASRLIDGFFG